MGNNQAKFLSEIDKITHQGPPTDIWSKIADGADGVTQKLFFEWIERTRESARKTAKKEKHHTKVYGSVVVSKVNIKGLPEKAQWWMEVKVQHDSKKLPTPLGKYTEETKDPSWEGTSNFDISGKGVTVEFKLHKRDVFGGLLPYAQTEWYIDPKIEHSEVVLNLKSALVLGKDKVAKLSFGAEFKQAVRPSTGDRGFIYASNLPVLDPNVPMPDLAIPTKSFTEQDESMKHIMYAVAIDWMVTGALNTRKTLPQPLQNRVDDAEGDDWWTNRRLNGDCAGFIQKNKEKTEEQPWDYFIEWDFAHWIDVTQHVKSGVSYPIYMCARFLLSEDGKSLVPHSIKYQKPGPYGPVTQPNDGSAKWKKLKALWRSLEMNIQFTWTHVGVHFNVEQYAMALYRNLSEGSPIYNLLTPHFENVISNNRLVVRPLPDGVVTRANIYTFDGQMKMLEERFSHLTYRTVPTRVLPTTIESNMFENTQEIMYDLISVYVEDYFKQHPTITIDQEIINMSNDLEKHALNKTTDAMKIRDLSDLKLLCKYVIFQAIFYHAWVHWNNYDDFAPTLIYDKESTLLPKDYQKLEDQSNMIQTFVELLSPTLKQWPIVDPDFGGPDRLKELLWQNASRINPNIMISTLIMAPNA